MNRDRRRGNRVPISTSFSEADPRTTTPVADLSRTGVLVVHTPLLPIGAHIQLRFVVFPDDPLLFVHDGRVVRHSSNPPGMGVEFDSMPDEVAEVVDEIIRRAGQQRQRTRRRARVLFDAHDLRTRILDD